MFAIREGRICVVRDDFRKAIEKVQKRGRTDRAPFGMYC
jgi:ATP-dependent 26S proteasome regulatory subunit